MPPSLLYLLAATDEEEDISFVCSKFPLDISNKDMNSVGLMEGLYALLIFEYLFRELKLIMINLDV